MPVPALNSDATLADVVGTLNKADDYGVKVYWKMKELEREHGPLEMRIGIRGTGKIPNYRFDEVSRRTFFTDQHFTSFLPVAAFDGRNHELLVPEGEEPDILKEPNWSKKGLALAEVEGVLKRIRGRK